jgi:hypothetical protein
VTSVILSHDLSQLKLTQENTDNLFGQIRHFVYELITLTIVNQDSQKRKQISCHEMLVKRNNGHNVSEAAVILFAL